jgi:hypothetical protein
MKEEKEVYRGAGKMEIELQKSTATVDRTKQ